MNIEVGGGEAGWSESRIWMFILVIYYYNEITSKLSDLKK